MAGLSFHNCADHKDECTIAVEGNTVILYDPNGVETKRHTCNFKPTKVYWYENVIVCENGSDQRGETISNVGIGVLPIHKPQASPANNSQPVYNDSNTSRTTSYNGPTLAGALAVGSGLLASGARNVVDSIGEKKLQKEIDKINAEIQRDQEERQRKAEAAAFEAWVNALEGENAIFWKKATQMQKRAEHRSRKRDEQIKNQPIPTEENFIQEYNEALLNSKKENDYDPNLMKYIEESNANEGVKETFKEYILEVVGERWAWERRADTLKDYAYEHYRQNTDIKKLLEDEFNAMDKEKNKSSIRKAIIRTLWCAIAFFAIFIMVNVGGFWGFILGVIVAAAVGYALHWISEEFLY